jgi:hypothetical protein
VRDQVSHPYIVTNETVKKMVVFWDVAACNLVDTGRHFRGAYFLHHGEGRKMI